MHGANEDIWAALERLACRAPTPTALQAHALEVFGARSWGSLGREVPVELRATERMSAAASLIVPHLVVRLRELHTGPLVVFKGPEIAARYSDPVLRPYRDLDVLVADAPALQQRLRGAGFEEVGDPVRYLEAPHSVPLRHPDLPVSVEVHGRPNWPDFISAPATAELLDHAVPARLGLDGVLTLSPVHHALVVAVHAWQHGPLARIRDLAEVLVFAREAQPGPLAATAEAWRLGHLWRTVVAVAEAAVLGRREPMAARIWGRHLRKARERTVLESHFATWMSPFWALPPGAAIPAVFDAVAADLDRKGDEGWRTKARRARRSLGNALRAKSAHDRELEPERDGNPRLAPRRRSQARRPDEPR